MAQNKILNLGSIFVIIASIIINFNSFLMGSASSWSNILTTILYIIFWYAFIIILKNNKKDMIYSTIWSLLTFVSALITLIVNLKPMIILDWAIPMAIVFITPLYGIEAMFTQSEYLFTSIVIIIISLTWVMMSLFFIKQ